MSDAADLNFQLNPSPIEFDAEIDLFRCAACGRIFGKSNAYHTHVGSCRKEKKRMASALESAHEAYRRKKLRLSTPLQAQPVLQPEINLPQAAGPSQEAMAEPSAADAANANNDDILSLAERRPRRQNRRLPLRYRDEQPAPPPSLPPVILTSPPTEESSPRPDRTLWKSSSNLFGVFRQYRAVAFPSHDPDSEAQLSDISGPVTQTTTASQSTSAVRFYPYPNQNAFLLGEWYWNGGVQKTREDFKKLVDIICNPSFNPVDVVNIPWDSLNKRLGETEQFEEDTWIAEPDAGWTDTSITLEIPFGGRAPNPGLRQFTFPPFRHRRIVSVLREKMANIQEFRQFHLEPYELRWRRTNMPAAESTRVHGELYASPAFLEAHEEIQTACGEPGCSLPRVLVGLMFGSDSTHLTSFGTSFVWPCYMYFGNESKYRRCKPRCNLCNHIAYFQKLPPTFKDFAASHSGKSGPTKAFMAHCRREFVHAQWRELLDDEFLEAYEHGVVIECCDGITRRFYLRIFAYSADYPEKTLLSSIRSNSDYPCPRCLVPKSNAHKAGTILDKNQRFRLARVDNLQYRVKITSAHKVIYEDNRTVTSKFLEPFLEEESLAPVQPAFSEKLSKFGFNFFSIFLVDFMHEFELGIWKKVFIHLLRILECLQGAKNKLDERFRAVPTFGRDSIRRFTNNVSELKKLGARDYENILQCSIPVFEGLLPDEHNSALMDLLFILAHWHTLAKLRQHTDLSLSILESVTVQLGESMRSFQETTCAAYQTKELKREQAARTRRAARKRRATAKSSARAEKVAGAAVTVKARATASSAPSSSSKSKATSKSRPAVAKPRATLNLNTYKDHALGDYVETIRRYGTTDSYSTEAMELEHRSPKSRYRRTSRKDFVKQLSHIERRQARIRRIRQKLNERIRAEESFVREKRPEIMPDTTYHIGKTQNYPLDLRVFARENCQDPAAKDFTRNLKKHLLPRIYERLKITSETLLPAGRESRTQVKQDAILIKDDRVYNHKLARFYYTTYDVRRAEDIINPKTTHCNVMLLSDLKLKNTDSFDDSTAHPFIYARVLGIYHVNVIYIGPHSKGYDPMRFEFLHVRWFQLDIPLQDRHQAGWTSSRLDRLSFPPTAEEDSFGFLDPSLVLRTCHVIPAFNSGKRHADGVGLSVMASDKTDYKNYYINRFADRDLAMRYHWGLGIGHKYSHGQALPSQEFSMGSSQTTNEEANDQGQGDEHQSSNCTRGQEKEREGGQRNNRENDSNAGVSQRGVEGGAEDVLQNDGKSTDKEDNSQAEGNCEDASDDDSDDDSEDSDYRECEGESEEDYDSDCYSWDESAEEVGSEEDDEDFLELQDTYSTDSD